jgi:hypothetical protein
MKRKNITKKTGEYLKELMKLYQRVETYQDDKDPDILWVLDPDKIKFKKKPYIPKNQADKIPVDK